MANAIDLSGKDVPIRCSSCCRCETMVHTMQALRSGYEDDMGRRAARRMHHNDCDYLSAGFLAVSYFDAIATISNRPSANPAAVSQVTVAVPASRETESYLPPYEKPNVYRQYRRTGCAIRPYAARPIRCVDSEIEGGEGPSVDPYAPGAETTLPVDSTPVGQFTDGGARKEIARHERQAKKLESR
jgi:hypothetical protein